MVGRLGKNYSQEEIENAKHSPSFDREYGLQYLGKLVIYSMSSQVLKSHRTWRTV